MAKQQMQLIVQKHTISSVLQSYVGIVCDFYLVFFREHICKSKGVLGLRQILNSADSRRSSHPNFKALSFAAFQY